MVFSEVFCVLFSLALLQSVSGQLWFSNGRPVSNHAYEDRGVVVRNGYYLSCTTDLRRCCSSSQGTWVRPSGVNVGLSGSDAYQSFEEGSIDLYVTISAMSGMYRCDIETSENERKSFYVGLYLDSEGEATITNLYLTVVRKQPPLFTLTCISSGGPVSDVDWLTPLGNLGVASELISPLTALYTHTVNVSRIDTTNRYGCFVYSRYRTSKLLRIEGTLGNMDVLQTGIGDIRANWSFSDVNGGIYYQRLGTHIVTWNTIRWQTENVIEGLVPGANYSLTLVHTTTSPATVKAADLIYIEPTNISVTTSHPLSVPAGNTVILTCSIALPSSVTGTPKFQWVWPDEASPSRVNGVLSLRNIGPSDVGVYTCTASLRGSVTGSIIIPPLTVEPPVVDISQDRYQLYAGTTVTFTCTATLSSSVRNDQQNIEISWSGLEEVYQRTIGEVVELSDGRYARNITISPLRYSYGHVQRLTCTGTITGENIQPATNSITSRFSTGRPYPNVYIYGTSEGTADNEIQLTCNVTLVEGLVVRPSVKWSGVGVEDNNVTESETVIISDTWSKRNLTFSPLKTSHGGWYRCTSINLYTQNEWTRFVYVQIPSPEVAVYPPEPELRSGSSLSLSCSLSPLSPSVDTNTTIQFIWTTPDNRYDRNINGSSDMPEDVLEVASVEAEDSGEYNCSVVVMDATDSYFIRDSEISSSLATVTVRPDAVIIPVYTPVQGENPDKLGPNEFTAGGILTLNCSLDTLSNGLTYTWSMAPHHDCTNCHTDLSSKTSQTLTVLLYSQYTGNYTCSINGSLTSQPFTVHLRGVGVYVSKRTPRSEVEPRGVGNNSVIVSGRDGVRFECVSNSSQDGIGTITTPNGATLRAGDSTEQLKITSEKPGVLTVETKEAVSLSDREQGIYTCTMSDSSGTDIVLNVGVYPSEFNDGPKIESMDYLTYRGSCGHVTCTSTASPPTTLTWTRDEELVSFEGSPNQTHSLSVTDRPSSTYSSLLSDREGVSGRYMCTVANEFGNDSREITVDSDCVGGMFEADAGEREVNFTWCPPQLEPTCTSHTPAYTITCSPPSLSTRHTLTPGNHTVAGFSPNTPHTCTISSSHPHTSLTNTSFTTDEDFSEFSIIVQFDEDSKNCSELLVMVRDNIMRIVNNSILQQLKKLCPDCTKAHIDREGLTCTNEKPPSMIYSARLAGTARNDSDTLVSALEMNGEIIVKFKDIFPDESKTERMGVYTGIVGGVATLVVVMATSVIVWRCCRATGEKKKKNEEMVMGELGRSEREGEGGNGTSERGYSYILVDKLRESSEKKGSLTTSPGDDDKSVAIETAGEGNENGTPDEEKPVTIETGVTTATSGGECGDDVRVGSPGKVGGISPPISTMSNTAYLPLDGSDGRAYDVKYVEMPSRPKAISEPPQPSVARKQGLTGIKTTPNAAYMEVTIAKQRQEPSEPLYEPIGDHSLWRERAKRGVLHLLHLSRSLPHHGATPTATPPQAPPTRAQSLPRGRAPLRATPKKTPPIVEDSPTRNRPPMPLPEETRREEEDDDDEYVYERVNTTD